MSKKVLKDTGAKVDVLEVSSDRTGGAGRIETLLRRFRGVAFSIMIIPILFLWIFCLGVSLAPAILLIHTAHVAMSDWHILDYCLTMGFAIAAGFFCFGFTLILVVPFVNWALMIKLKPWRGPVFSLKTIPWYYHNALTHLVRYTFLEFITPSPINILFYRLMGMKIGKGVQIATTNISDPCLITIEDNVTIGGSATLIGHYAMRGFLVLAPVHIKQGATIGLKVSVFGDVVIGEKSLVTAHTVLMPKTRIDDNTTV